MTRKKEGMSGALKGAQNTSSPTQTRQTEQISRDQLRENTAARLEKFARIPSPEIRGGSTAAQSPLTTRTGKQERGQKLKSAEGGLSGSKDTVYGGEGSHQEDISEMIELQSAKVGSVTQNDEPTLREIMLAIRQCTIKVTGLAEQLQGIRVDISLLRQDAQKIRERTEVLENRVSEAEDKLVPLNKGLKKITQRLDEQLQKVENLENSMRRNNLRLLGFPEKAEGNNPVEFMEKWLGEAVGKEFLSPYFAVERAHRVPMRAGAPGDAPRSFLIRLLNYIDKETILRRARVLQELSYNGVKIMIFPDYSPEVRKRRVSFQEVKKRMRSLQLQYAIMYPAKLRVQVQDSGSFLFHQKRHQTGWIDILAAERDTRREGEKMGEGVRLYAK